MNKEITLAAYEHLFHPRPSSPLKTTKIALIKAEYCIETE